MLYHPQDAEDATQEILLKARDPALVVRGSEQLPHLALPDRRQPRAEYEARASGAGGHKFQRLWPGDRQHT